MKKFRLYELQLAVGDSWIPRDRNIWDEREKPENKRKVYGGPCHFYTSKEAMNTMSWFCLKYGKAGDHYRIVRLERKAEDVKGYQNLIVAAVIKEQIAKTEGSYWLANPNVPGVISANGAHHTEMKEDKRQRQDKIDDNRFRRREKMIFLKRQAKRRLVQCLRNMVDYQI